MPGKSRKPDADTLWKRVVEDVRPIKRRASKTPLPSGEREGPKPKAWEGEGTKAKPGSRCVPPPSPPRPPPGPPLPPSGRGVQNTLDASWDRRLARGMTAPDLTIDLHGHTLSSAHAELEAGLTRAVAMQARLILLVTGRAPPPGRSRLDNPLRGVIRASIGDWLHHARHASHIAAVRNAHPRHGGAGALYVVLRRTRE